MPLARGNTIIWTGGPLKPRAGLSGPPAELFVLARRSRGAVGCLLTGRCTRRNHLLDFGAQFLITEHAGMVHGDHAAAIDEHQRRRGAGAVAIKIQLADGHRHGAQVGIILTAHAVNVLQLGLRRGGFAISSVTVTLSWTEQRQALGAVFALQSADNRLFVLAVSTPVGPEKK